MSVQGVGVGVIALIVAGAVPTWTGVAVGADEPIVGPIPRPECGPDASEETGVQGQVPRADRDSGRSAEGYWCNLELLGQHQGKGAGPVSATYEHCSYTGTFVGDLVADLWGVTPGVEVLDVSDPTAPTPTTVLSSTAMRTSTWETLTVHQERGLLAGAGVPLMPGLGVGAFDVYDLNEDCTDPVLLNGLSDADHLDGVGGPLDVTPTTPLPIVAHEGNFAPDGRTYYATSAYGATVTAIDLDDPTDPQVLFAGSVGIIGNHGLSLSEDGRTMYAVSLLPAGLHILDVSDIQDRAPVPQIREIALVTWPDEGLASQMTIPITVGGTPHLIVVDEAGNGHVRIFDIADPAQPRLVRRLLLEIALPENQQLRQEDVGGNGLFGYEAHYCSVDRQVDPTALACGYFHSGIRVFDIRDLTAPVEIAYFNPPAQTGATLLDLPNSTHAVVVFAPPLLSTDSITLGSLADSVLDPDMTADWCMSPPEFVGDDMIWVTCNDNGFLALQLSEEVWPLEELPAQDEDVTVGDERTAELVPDDAPVTEPTAMRSPLPVTGAGAARSAIALAGLGGVLLLVGRGRRAAADLGR